MDDLEFTHMKPIHTKPHDLSPVDTQFTVLIANNEQLPYDFQGMYNDAGRPLNVISERATIGIGQGDYTLRGFEPSRSFSQPDQQPGDIPKTVSIERKSLADAHGTILGWSGGRDNFERELSILNGLTFAAVVVEATEPELYALAPNNGQRTAAQNRKTLSRTLMFWRLRWPRVQWIFSGTRRMAEVQCFRLLECFWREYSR